MVSFGRNRLGYESDGVGLEARKMLAASDEIDMDTMQETNFDDGDYAPFQLYGSGGSFENGSYVTRFDADTWSEQRWNMGSEVYSADDFRTTNGYVGFNMYVPSDEFPDDATSIVHQWWQQNQDGESLNWTAVLEMRGDQLYFRHRAASVASTDELLGTVPRDEWVELKTRVIPGRDGVGRVTVFMNDELVLDKSTNVGWGDFDADGYMDGDYIRPKVGMYYIEAYDGTTEDATLYFDDVSWFDNSAGLSGGDAWTRVDPGEASSTIG